ncbi:MAG TPA: hypothetical protein VEB40_16765 [Flavipsychrobacter sp.]|nr:hypothetical protein [Flavipsychrobacter sp.]
MITRILFSQLLVLMLCANLVNAQKYEAHFVIRKGLTTYELRSDDLLPTYVPTTIGYLYISHDSVIFEERDFSIYDHAIPNAFPPPEFVAIDSITTGKLDELGQQWFETQKKRADLSKKRWFFRAFRMTYDEYMSKNGIKIPWMTTYKDFERQYSFLIEGDGVFK